MDKKRGVFHPPLIKMAYYDEKIEFPNKFRIRNAIIRKNRRMGELKWIIENIN